MNQPPHPTYSRAYGGVADTIPSKRNAPHFSTPPDAGVSNPRFNCFRTGTPICGQTEVMS